MKKTFALTTKALLLFSFSFFISIQSKAQFTFTVNPGIGLTGANFGYMKKNFNAFIGLQYFGAGLTNESVYGEYDSDLQKVVGVKDKNEFSGKVIMPSIGLKYFLKTENKVKVYAQGTLSKPFVKARITNNGVVNQEFEDAVKKLKLLGGELGFGMEYFFDNNFSIGGEFGCRFLSLKLDYSYDEEVYNPNTQDTEIFKASNQTKAKISPVFTKICLNFYLRGKKG